MDAMGLRVCCLHGTRDIHGDNDGDGPGISAVSDGDCDAGLIYNASAASMFCEAPVCNIAIGTADHSVCCGPLEGVVSDMPDTYRAPTQRSTYDTVWA
jgi:hypothetical protein